MLSSGIEKRKLGRHIRSTHQVSSVLLAYVSFETLTNVVSTRHSQADSKLFHVMLYVNVCTCECSLTAAAAPTVIMSLLHVVRERKSHARRSVWSKLLMILFLVSRRLGCVTECNVDALSCCSFSGSVERSSNTYAHVPISKMQ